MADPDAFAEMEAFAAEEDAPADPPPADPPPAEDPPEEALETGTEGETEGDSDGEPGGQDDEAAARALGWRPEGEWKGKPEDWQDAGAFLERARHNYSTVRKLERQFAEEQKRNEERFRKFGELAEQQRQRAVAEAEARMKAAKEDLDFDGYEAAAKERAALDVKAEQDAGAQQRAEVQKQVQEYRETNEWAKSDFVWAKVAAEVGPLIDQRIKAGEQIPVPQQMKMAEDAAKALFPDAFPKPASKPTTASVDGGGLRQPGKRTETGWDDLAPEDRSFLADMIENGDFKNRAEAVAYYRTAFKE